MASAEPIVTPDPAAMVVCPAPIDATLTTVPTANATDEFGGTVNVFADALFIVTIFPASVNANVYVVPVWEFNVVPVAEMVIVEPDSVT